MQKNYKVLEWIQWWLEKYKKPVVKRSTYVAYLGYFENYFSKLGDIYLNELNVDMLQNFFDQYVIGNGLKPKTIHNIAICLRNSLNRAIQNELIESNPANYLELPKFQKPKIKALTREEEKRLVEKCQFSEIGVFVLLVLCTGIRLGELLALRWENIDFESKTLHIEKSLIRAKNFDDNNLHKTSLFLETPKTENSIRDIPLFDGMLTKLHKLQEEQKENGQPCHFIVSKGDGKYVDPKYFKNRYNALLKQCDLENYNFHTLRHTFATRAIEEGVNTKVLSKILGHYSIVFTLDTYAHVLTNFQRQQMALMNELTSDTKDDQLFFLKLMPTKDKYIAFQNNNPKNCYIANSLDESIAMLKEFHFDNTAFDIQNFMKNIKEISGGELFVLGCMPLTKAKNSE